MRYLLCLLMFVYVSSTQADADKDITITETSCKVATNLARKSLALYRKGSNRFEVMSMLNLSPGEMGTQAYAGKVYTQLNVVDLDKNVARGYKDAEIIQVFVTNCNKSLGFRFTKG